MTNEKITFILEKSKSKTVLDVGCGGAFAYFDDARPEDTLIYDLIKTSKHVVGIDIDQKAIDNLFKFGFEVYQGDAQNLQNLPYTHFEVIVASDLIEHLPNLEGFFMSMRRYMDADSTLILSSHYPYSFNNFLRVITFREPNVRTDHVCSFEKANLERLCEMHGLKLIQFKLYTADDNRTTTLKVKSKLHRYIATVFPGFNYGWYAVIRRSV
jgi:SAM-dependent methyltransferase